MSDITAPLEDGNRQPQRPGSPLSALGMDRRWPAGYRWSVLCPDDRNVVRLNYPGSTVLAPDSVVTRDMGRETRPTRTNLALRRLELRPDDTESTRSGRIERYDAIGGTTRGSG
jgi:hypothetical protein